MKVRQRVVTRGMDGLELVVLGYVGGTLSMNECGYAAAASKARAGSRQRPPMLEGCHLSGTTPLEPKRTYAAARRLRQQCRRK
jgi:hypothetical protein